jgi:arginine decarboxylase
VIGQGTAPRTPKRTDQSALPFVQDLIRRVERPGVSFHMPGHKQAVPAHPLLRKLLGEAAFRADLSEIGGIDYLHAPRGALRRAQQLAAQAVGADRTFFLVNGSTVGNQAAVLSVVRDGQKVLVPRNSHCSVFGALALAGAVPVYVVPSVHPLVGEPVAVDAGAAAAVAEAASGLAALHLTSPDYYGCSPDLAAFRRLARRHGIPFLVDEAHGAHFSFHKRLPTSAIRAGADLVVQSTHKTAGSLTQSSMLHWRKGRVDPSAVQQVLALLQSSSPSALLTASLDAARALMATQGETLLVQALALADQARAEIRTIPDLWCLGDDLVGKGGVAAYDPTKLLVRVADLGLTGFDAAQWLGRHRGVEVELANRWIIVCSITFADSEATVARLLAALRDLVRTRRKPAGKHPNRPSLDTPWPGLPRVAVGLREAHFASTKRVAFRAAISRICAEPVIPYPPGIPVLLPGEIIEAQIAAYIRDLMVNGASITGPEDLTLRHIRVIA